MMKIYTLEREQIINASLDKAWQFFSSPENLEALTPDNMGFDIITQRPLPPMHEGQLIEYKVRPILNVPIYWKTEILDVVERQSFVDKQLRGPYALWLHTHTFAESEEGIVMNDRVEYALPLGILGSIAHRLFVKNKLEQIFDYRYIEIEKIFAKTN